MTMSSGGEGNTIGRVVAPCFTADCSIEEANPELTEEELAGGADGDAGQDGTWDPVTDERIAELHPDIRDDVTEFINRVEEEEEIQLRVTQGYRSFEEQNALYAQGRTQPGNIVTNAQGGQSYHNYGLAFDVVEISNGQANWDTSWDAIGRIGEDMGFEWGGNWTNFPDRPHFQQTFGLSTNELRALYDAGQLQDGFVTIPGGP